MTQDAAMTDSRIDNLARALVSPKTGVLRRLVRLPLMGGQIPYHHFVAVPADYRVLPTGGEISRPGGSSTTAEGGVASVVMEAVERYCAAFVDFTSCVLSGSVGPPFEAGARVQRFADFQYETPGFPFAKIDAEHRVHWVNARSLFTGERRFVPAAITYLPFTPSSQDEVLGPSFSNGMASGWTWEQAAAGGLLELIERDGFAIVWANRLVKPRLVPVPGTALAGLVDVALEHGASDVTFVETTSHDVGIPSVAALLTREAQGRRIRAMGMSCHPHEERACAKALAESISEYERIRFQLTNGDYRDWVPGENYENVVDFEWHGWTYADESLQGALDFLYEGPMRPVVSSPEHATPSLAMILDRLRPVCSDVLLVELTTPDMAGFGVRVVKMFAPELIPIHADHKYPYLGHERLWTAGGLYPDRQPQPGAGHLNPMPHPFS